MVSIQDFDSWRTGSSPVRSSKMVTLVYAVKHLIVDEENRVRAPKLPQIILRKVISQIKIQLRKMNAQ